MLENSIHDWGKKKSAAFLYMYLKRSVDKDIPRFQKHMTTLRWFADHFVFIQFLNFSTLDTDFIFHYNDSSLFHLHISHIILVNNLDQDTSQAEGRQIRYMW